KQCGLRILNSLNPPPPFHFPLLFPLCSRFRVDFAFAKHEGADLAFHFNPRFDLNELVIDTFESGRWGKAERHKNPFRKGKPFELIFIVTEAGYQVGTPDRGSFGTAGALSFPLQNSLFVWNEPQIYCIAKLIFHYSCNANSH
uniref:Galectin n=1 Tax=Naja naja TaxID=35670 RepID=A0A8C6Y704_NAJNA